jgi:hypothetical protein
LSLHNDVPLPKASKSGGPNQQTFAYDDLYRLTSASGTWPMSARKTRRYRLGMTYDELHNIVNKTQTDDILQSQKELPQRETTYTWSYSYASSRPHAATKIGDRSYSYDASGNMLTWAHDQNGTRGARWEPGRNAVSPPVAGHGVLHDERAIARKRLDPCPLASRRHPGPEVPPRLHAHHARLLPPK